MLRNSRSAQRINLTQHGYDSFIKQIWKDQEDNEVKEERKRTQQQITIHDNEIMPKFAVKKQFYAKTPQPLQLPSKLELNMFGKRNTFLDALSSLKKKKPVRSDSLRKNKDRENSPFFPPSNGFCRPKSIRKTKVGGGKLLRSLCLGSFKRKKILEDIFYTDPFAQCRNQQERHERMEKMGLRVNLSEVQQRRGISLEQIHKQRQRYYIASQSQIKAKASKRISKKSRNFSIENVHRSMIESIKRPKEHQISQMKDKIRVRRGIKHMHTQTHKRIQDLNLDRKIWISKEISNACSQHHCAGEDSTTFQTSIFE